jgi:hypothetical protein
MPPLIQRAISRTIRGTKPQTVSRMKALANVRWVLVTDDDRFVAVDDRAQASLVHHSSQAVIYDGRDNEELKVRFFEALFKVPLTVVLVDQ